MKQVNIFLAGSTSLTDERNTIRAKVQELGQESLTKIAGFTFNVESFDSKRFNNCQEEYYKYIKNEADIVFFLFGEIIFDYTRKEFQCACESYDEKGKPEIVMFFRAKKVDEHGKITDEDANESEVCQLIETTKEIIAKADNKADTDDNKEKKHAIPTFYVKYIENEELKPEVEKRIKYYLWPSIKKIIKMMLYGIGSLFALSLLLLGCIWLQGSQHQQFKAEQHQQDSVPILLFAGGGSVANYLMEVKGVNVKSYPHSIYTRMPSNHALVLLSEEGNRENKIINFYPICLSADSVSESDFMLPGTKEIFKKKRAILSYCLGKEPLVVYMSDTLYKEMKDRHPSLFLDDRTLSSRAMDTIIIIFNKTIKSPKFYLFTTSPGSGTLQTFQSQEVMSRSSADLLDLWMRNKRVTYYNEMSPLDIFSKTPFIILGSEYYSNLALDSVQNQSQHRDYKYRRLYLSDYHNDTIKDHRLKKSLFLYFIGTLDEHDSRQYRIPDRTFQFLQEIDPDFDTRSVYSNIGLILPVNY